MPKVFISYSWDSEEHKDWVFQISEQLRHGGLECKTDHIINGFPPEGWTRWMENSIEWANYVLIVCTPLYLKRFRGLDTEGGCGVTFEGAMINQMLYDAHCRNTKFIPVIPETGSIDNVPLILKGYSTYSLPQHYDALYRVLTGQAEYLPSPVGTIKPMPAKNLASTTPTTNTIHSNRLVNNEYVGASAEAEINEVQGDNVAHLEITSNITGSTIHGSVVTAEKIEGSFNVIHHHYSPAVIHHHYSPAEQPDNPQSGRTKRDEPPTIHSNRLPTTLGKFFGREPELKLLDNALSDQQTAIVQFVAAGGTGKTKLLQYWLDQHKDIPVLIAWSFYSQGASEDKQTTASPFFEHLFYKFAVTPPVFPSEADKGEYAAELLMRQPCVLVLDGLEPLQHAGKGMRGELKDRAVRALLKRLASQSTVLCVITTRIAAPELNGQTVQTHSLHNLEKADGVRLLRDLGVKGTYTELETAVTDYEQHALAIYLLGNLLVRFLGGDINKRDQLGELLEEDGEPSSCHAFKVMQAYADFFKDCTELNILMLLGLFDHPIDRMVLNELRHAQIAQLTAGINERDFNRAIASLIQDHHLLTSHADQPDLLDCHPLIREYFGKQLQQHQPDAYQQAHTRLFEYYQALPTKQQPDTLAEMQPLFAAISHGCAAGLYQQAMDDVYWLRVQHKNEFYLTNKLGAFSDDLAALAHFFTLPYSQPVTALTEQDQAAVLSWAAFRLRALGRLTEAVPPLQSGLAMRVKQQDWQNAAKDASNLSELLLSLGKVAEARHYGSLSVDYAEQSDIWSERIASRTTLAGAQFNSGEFTAALELFQQAEQRQQQRQPEYPVLYSLQGFHYCDCLLAQGEAAAVLLRGEQTLAWATKEEWLLDLALDLLSLAKAHAQLAMPSQTDPHAALASDFFQQAVAALRTAGHEDYLVHGLLARAAWLRFCQDYPAAHKDLNEALEIAEPAGMRLHLCDYHLESASLALAEQTQPALKDHIQQAAELIQATGYHRRDKELQDLQQALL